MSYIGKAKHFFLLYDAVLLVETILSFGILSLADNKRYNNDLPVLLCILAERIRRRYLFAVI